MGRKYDLENLVADVQALLAASLVAKVTAIEAEQVAAGLPAAWPSPEAPAIDADAYYSFGWTDESLNKSVGVAVFLAEQTSEGQGPFTLLRYVLDIGVYMSGTNNDPLADRKLLRYSKALKELLEEKWTKINNAASKEKVETVGPIDFKFNVDSSDNCKIAGVTLSCTLG